MTAGAAAAEGRHAHAPRNAAPRTARLRPRPRREIIRRDPSRQRAVTSRRAPAGDPATQQGWVYLLHLLPAYPVTPGPTGHQVRHYSGWALDVAARLRTHAAGGPDAARLLQVQREAGGTWQLAAIEWGTRDREIQLKYRGAARSCPVCTAGQAPPGPPSAMGWMYTLHLDLPRRRAPRPGDPLPPHRGGFTADTTALLAAARRRGTDAGRALRVRAEQGGRWRLVAAEWLPETAAAQQLTGPAAPRCPACSPPRSQPRPGELLAAIARGEVADRYHPGSGWAARWHTRYGEPLTTGGVGGHLGRSVTGLAAALADRGLAVRTGGHGHEDRPYLITEAGREALRAAAGRGDGLPVNKDRSVSRSRTTDSQKEQAGLMTSAQKSEHTALRGLDRSRRRAERLTGPQPPDPWTIPAPAADPSWPAGVRDGIAAALGEPGGPRHRPAGGLRRAAVPRPSRGPGLP